MEGIINQIKQFANAADVGTRDKLKTALRDAMYSLEDDDDVVRRVGYYAGPINCAQNYH